MKHRQPYGWTCSTTLTPAENLACSRASDSVARYCPGPSDTDAVCDNKCCPAATSLCVNGPYAGPQHCCASLCGTLRAGIRCPPRPSVCQTAHKHVIAQGMTEELAFCIQCLFRSSVSVLEHVCRNRAVIDVSSSKLLRISWLWDTPQRAY